LPRRFFKAAFLVTVFPGVSRGKHGAQRAHARTGQAERPPCRDVAHLRGPYLAAVLEENGIEPNPARDKRVRLRHAERSSWNRRRRNT
jgi:hypothetical protein